MTKQRLLLYCLNLAAFAGLAFGDSFTLATTNTGSNTIGWSQLGPNDTVLTGSPGWVASNGATGTITDNSNLERRDEIAVFTPGSFWTGNFATGDQVIWNQGGPNSIDIHFDSPISFGGAKIEDDFFGPFNACITALGSFGTSGPFCENGDSEFTSDNSAIFLGISDTTGAKITDLIFSVTDAENDFAIDTVSFSGAAVPEPASFVLLGSGILAMVGLKRARKG